MMRMGLGGTEQHAEVWWVGGFRDHRNWRNPQHCFSFVCIVMALAFEWIVCEDCLSCLLVSQ